MAALKKAALLVSLLAACPCRAGLSEGLSLEKKVGQLFMVGYGWGDPSSVERFSRWHLGNVCLAKRDVEDLGPEEVARLVGRLQVAAREANGVPLLVATDQEGGRVDRLRKGFTTYPGARLLAKTSVWPEGAEKAARHTARQLRAAGVHVNFAPVLDVDVAPENAVSLQGRVFGSDPTEVSRWAGLFVKAFRAEGIIACVKHFPNDGDVTGDPHRAPAVNKQSLDHLWNVSLKPYRDLIGGGELEMVMAGHARVVAWDPSAPGSLSKAVIQGVLREKLGFQGVVVVDELNMPALGGNVGENAVRALEAGADILLFVGKDADTAAAYNAVLGAVRSGRIGGDSLDASVDRVLALKRKVFQTPKAD